MPFKKVKESIRAYHSGELANVKKSETNFEHHQSPLVYVTFGHVPSDCG